MNFDIYSVKEESVTLKLEGGKLSSLKEKSLSKHGVRRFENGKVYTSSVVGECMEDQLKASNLESSKFGFDHSYGFCLERTETREGKRLDNKVLDEFAKLATELPEKYPDYVFSGQCQLSNSRYSFKSDYGCDLKASGGVADWYMLYQKVGSKNMMDGFFMQKSVSPNFEKSFGLAKGFLDTRGIVAKLNSGRMPVIFVHPFGAMTKMNESFLINKYESGASLFSGKKGEKLFSEQVSIIDSGYSPDNGAVQFFDGEGVVRDLDDLVLVENGVFKSVLSDLRLGKKYNTNSTGNGLRAFNTGCNLGVRNLLLKPGKETWLDIAKGLDQCLFAVLAAGGDSNELGEFSTPVQVGYILEKGEVVGEAPQLTVKSNVQDFLGKDLIGISSDNYEGSNWYGLAASEVEVFVH